MKHLMFLSLLVLLSGCAANLQFTDRQTGVTYTGQTGATVGSSGELHANIAGEHYAGQWIYTPSGGGYTIGSMNSSAVGPAGYSSSYGTVSGFTTSASGNGLMTMHGDSGSYLRCVFNFNSFSNTGIGECQRNDGKLFDVTIKR